MQRSHYRDSVEHYADDTRHHARHSAEHALDRVAEGYEHARSRVAPAIDRFTSRAEELAHRGSRAFRDGSHQLRERTADATHSGLEYARHQPVKTALLALGVVAATFAVISLFRANAHAGHGARGAPYMPDESSGNA